MTEGATSGVCRLCAEFGLCINIFSDLGQTQSLQSKITECLSLAITEQDVLPRSVCLSCVTKLNTSFELKMTCITAQAKLQALSCQKNPADSSLPKAVIPPSPPAPVKDTPNGTVVTSAASSSNEIQMVQHYFICPDQVFCAPEQVLNNRNISNNTSNTTGLAIESVRSMNSTSQSIDAVARSRKKERKTVCQYCRKWFPRTIIEHHENLHIRGGVFFTCVICNNNFRTKQEFKSHRCDQ